MEKAYIEQMIRSDREHREAFGRASVELMHLAARHALKGNERAKQKALNAALFAFMKEHQVEALGPEDWEKLDTLPIEDDDDERIGEENL
jgi:hypothetical protein